MRGAYRPGYFHDARLDRIAAATPRAGERIPADLFESVHDRRVVRTLEAFAGLCLMGAVYFIFRD
jgi:hypothetical protein